MYNDKVSEVKDIIGIGPAVKNILTVSQLEDTGAYMPLLLAKLKSFLSSSLRRSLHSFQFDDSFYVIVKECFKKLKKLSNWLEKFKPIGSNRNCVMTVIRKLRYAIKFMKFRLNCGWKQFSC